MSVERTERDTPKRVIEYAMVAWRLRFDPAGNDTETMAAAIETALLGVFDITPRKKEGGRCEG